MDFKWLLVPFSNRTKKIEVPHLWEVRWISLRASFGDGDANYCEPQPEIEAFVSKQDADEFMASLNNAAALLRHSNVDYKIRMEKGKSA